MTYRGGFDVTETVYIKESTFGTTPSEGTWLPIWRTTNFNPRIQMIYKESTGLGSQVITDFTKVKEYVECDIEHEILKKQTSPAYNWKDFYLYIVSTGQSGTPSNTIDSFSLGAKLDLATDEFWHLKGCKIQSYEIRGDSIEDIITGRISIIGQYGRHTTTDYVTGTASRQANPTSDTVHFGEADLLIGGSSIYGDLSRWSLTFARTIERKGTDSTTKTLYKSLVETAREYTLEITRDFNSTNELSAFQNASDVSATIKLPNESGGVQIDLTDGKWERLEAPAREIDLIALTLTAKFKTLTVSDIS